MKKSKGNLKQVLLLTIFDRWSTDAVTVHISKWGKIVVRWLPDALGVGFPLHTTGIEDD